MTDQETPRIRRRAVLGAVVGGAAAAAAAALAAPAAMLGDNGQPMTLGAGNTATATTTLDVTGSRALDLHTNGGDGLRGWTDGAGVSGVFGYATDASSFGVYGKNGGRGVAALGTYNAALWASTAGYAAPLALKVEGNSSFVGKATFSRSGRATVKAGHASVDVDLNAKGGLAGSPLCFANLLYYRTGVQIAAIRPNWPTAGKMRIHLNKSVSLDTKVAWVVLA